MAEVKWIKIVTDIFDDEKILMIETLPECDTIIVIWFKLLCLAGKKNNCGVFQMGHIPYTDEMFATIFRRPLNTVRLALKTFEQFGMVEIVNNTVTIPNWSRHQSLDAYEKRKERDRLYQAERRAAQRALIEKSSDKSSDKSADASSDVAPLDKTRLEEDKNREDIDNRNNDSGESVSCQQIVDLFHSICKSYPKIRSLSDARKKAIKARLKTYTLQDFQNVFENAENSSFLKGKNDRNWSANFDWLIADKNMAKVLENAYADRGRKEAVPGWMNKPRELDEDEVAAIHRMLTEDQQQEAERLRQQFQSW